MNGENFKNKIYLASVSASREITDALDLSEISNLNVDSGVISFQHIPYFTMANSLEEVIQQTKDFAFEKWRKSDGWENHNAMIAPITEKFLPVIENAYPLLEYFDRTSEEERHVFFEQDENIPDHIM